MPGSSKEWLALAGALVLFAALPLAGAPQNEKQHAGHGHAGQDHAGHDQGAAEAPAGEGEQEGQGHEAHGGEPAHAGHAGHAAGESPAATSPPAPVAVPSEQPAKTLQPDALDAPAATSVVDAQRSAEMARGMAGGHGGHAGHGGHGVRRYRHVDAGRGPEAYLEKDMPPGSGSGNESPPHDHGSAGAGGEHSGHGAQERQEATLYVCPMHPEVTSAAPGTCSKCGMALVERRKE